MNLSHHFLVSMPQMQDPYFRHSVIYILDHGVQGAFGVVINSPLEMNIESLLSQLDIDVSDDPSGKAQVLQGGPVDEEHGLVLHGHGPKFKSTHEFDHGISLSSSLDALESIAQGQMPTDFLIVLGHSGWATGQLEMEIADNAWLTCEANADVLFKTPAHERRQAVAKLIGVDISNVVGHSGNA